MAIGKNKRMMKKKGGKKKPVDPLTRKEWYSIKVPAAFDVRTAGRMPINRSQGLRIADVDILGRVVETSLADIAADSEDKAHIMLRFVCEQAGGNVATMNYHGLRTSRDRLCSLIRKGTTLLEGSVDVRTTDGYTIRAACIGFTKRRPNQVKKTSYCTTAQAKKLRLVMTSTMTAAFTAGTLQDAFQKVIAESVAADITRLAEVVFPLEKVLVHKLKVLTKPRFDLAKLMELHGHGEGDKGKAVKKADEGVVEELSGAGGRL